MSSLAQGAQNKTSATARVRFTSWAEFARFVQQEGGARGLFMRAASPPPIGTELTVHFVLPDHTDLTLPGRVVHRLSADEAQANASEPGMGVQFTHMSAEQAERLEALMQQAVAHVSNGQPAPKPANGVRSIPAQASEIRASQPGGRDPRLDQVAALLERSRFDAAEKKAVEILTDTPNLTAARILLLVTQARRASSQFDFEHAIDLYGSVLMLDSSHEEAVEQMRHLPGQLEHTKELNTRVFGKQPGPRFSNKP